MSSPLLLASLSNARVFACHVCRREGRAVRLRPLPSPAMSASTSHLPSPSQPEALTEALVSSLSSVQHHALLVKKTLEAAQSVVSVQDSKARHLLNMIAAERLFHALSLLPRVDLRRGWIAWRLHLHQQIREQRLRAVLRQLVLRNVVMGLHQIIQRLLRHRIATWKTFTLTETQRLRRQRILQATVTIQSAMRTCLAKKCVALLRQRKKYEKLYDATITLQRIMRGKRIRWRFLALCEERRRQDAILLVQRVFRGYRGRRHAAWVKFKRNRSGAAIRIQTMLRCAFARRKVKQLRKQRREGLAAVRIQALVRGVLARSAVASQLIERARSHYATKIQARVRGMITRRHRHRKMREIAIYKQARYDAARRIQAAYRGYRSRVLYRLMMFQWTQERNRAHRASTQITRIVRGYLSRKEMRRLKRQRREQWIAQARAWQECWDDDQSSYYYQHRETGVCHWEPTREGYTKYDGKLVLASGEIITDPAQVLGGGGSSLDGEAGDGLDFGDGKGGGGGQMSSLSRSLGHVLCIECSERVAIRRCVECGDNFCTKCYTALHLLGARRHHTYEPLGPRDCDECNLVLAERYCHACDECFCDGCWRSLHSHGKRVYHPYSEVSLEGRIDSRVYTMDGERLEEGGAAGAAAGGAVDVGMYTQAAADVAQARTLAQKIQGTVDAYSQLVVPSYGQGQGGEVAVYGGEGGGEEAAGADWSSTEGAVVSAGAVLFLLLLSSRCPRMLANSLSVCLCVCCYFCLQEKTAGRCITMTRATPTTTIATRESPSMRVRTNSLHPRTCLCISVFVCVFVLIRVTCLFAGLLAFAEEGGDLLASLGGGLVGLAGLAGLQTDTPQSSGWRVGIAKAMLSGLSPCQRKRDREKEGGIPWPEGFSWRSTG